MAREFGTRHQETWEGRSVRIGSDRFGLVRIGSDRLDRDVTSARFPVLSAASEPLKALK